MPNWAHNVLTITGPETELTRFIENDGEVVRLKKPVADVSPLGVGILSLVAEAKFKASKPAISISAKSGTAGVLRSSEDRFPPLQRR
jgi:hypothetical protein